MSGYQHDPTQPQFSDALTQHIRQTIVDVLSDQTSLPADFKSWLPKYLEANPPLLPISQIFGFAQFTAKTSGSVLTSETTASAAYVDLATVGPTISGLPPGQYVVMYSAFAKNSAAANLSVFSPSFNAATPVDADQGGAAGTDGSYSMAFTIVTLSSASNTVKLQYKASAGTGTFINRRLVALKYGNL